jgi:ribosomal protein S12 methylthiotransferase
MENLIREAETLAEAGVKELNLVAQETTRYGVDLYGEKRLHVLLERLCAIEGLHWIRVLYCYPEEIYPELIETMKNQPKICRYLDLPIQHCSDEILRRMGRRTDKRNLTRIIETLREAMPDIVLRTTLITGFPGETDAQHAELLDFVEETAFDRLGVFCYSREEGTPAAEMPDQVDEETKEKRREEIMLLQQEISLEKNQERIGQELEIFVEGYLPEDGVYAGRTYADAPNIDGYLFLTTDRTLSSGMFVRCIVTEASEYDLAGECI